MEQNQQAQYKEALRRAAQQIRQLDAELQQTRQQQQQPIAIIGIGCRLPGGADDADSYWQLLRDGRDACGTVPEDRFDIAAWYDPQRQPKKAGRSYTRHGSFITDIQQFDARFFDITPVEATALDPQQRLMLEVCWQALQHAGLDPQQLRGSRTGVFAGISANDYVKAHLGSGQPSQIGPYSLTGVHASTAPGRLAYYFDWHGPCFAVDTACSSSLVALHQAILSLRAGECDLAVVSGVNLMLTPEPFVAFSQLDALAPDGRCKTFAANADGYGRGEGCGVLILRRFDEAQAQGDRVLALVAGSAVNQDGRSNGLTAPNGVAQQQVISAALAQAGLGVDELDYVELHGTGTPLGDPVEAQALAQVFAQRSTKLAVGSVKSQIGHLEAAAGIAGLLKLVLAIQHQQLPGSLHCDEPNPLLSAELAQLDLVQHTRPFTAVSGRAALGISSFGFSGTNAHVILRAAPTAAAATSPDSADTSGYQLLPLSAKTPAALAALAASYVQLLQRAGTLSLPALAASAWRSRAGLPQRQALVFADQGQLLQQLAALADTVPAPVDKRAGRLGWCFAGQGSQALQMGAALYQRFSPFRLALDQAEQHILATEGWSLLALLYPNQQQSAQSNAQLAQTRYTQPAIVAVQYALAQLWLSTGASITMLAGHSIGGLSAAAVAGCYSLPQALTIACVRGELMQRCGAGQMLALECDSQRAEHILAAAASQIPTELLVLAADNSDHSVTFSGSQPAIAWAQQWAEQAGIRATLLDVQQAFHSPLFEPVLAEFAQRISGITASEPRYPLISDVDGEPLTASRLTPAYWAAQIVAPVRFRQAAAALAQRCDILLELGGRTTLASLLARQYPDHLVLSSLRKQQPADQSWLSAVAALYQAGVRLDPRSWCGPQLPVLDLPQYPFERQFYWIPLNQQDNQRASQPLANKEVLVTTSAVTTSEWTLSALQQEIGELVQRISGLNATELAADAHWFELGLDSLMVVQLQQRVQQRFGIELAVEQVFSDFSSVSKLAAELLTTHAAALPARQSAPVPQDTASGVGAMLPGYTAPAQQLLSMLPGSNQPGLPLADDTGVNQLLQLQMSQLQQMNLLMVQQLQLLTGGIADEMPPVQPAVATSRPALSASGTPVFAAAPKPVASVPALVQQGKNEARGMQFNREGLNAEQLAFVRELTQAHNLRTAGSKAYAARYRPVLADWIASLNFSLTLKEIVYPLVAERSAGSRFWDIDGHEYIDISCSYGVGLFGHNPDFVRDAISAQLQLGMELGPQSALAGEVASLIAELTGVERVAFCNTGSEAVTVAIRLARTVTGRRKLVIFKDSYHGTYDGVLADNGQDGSVPAAPGIPAGMVEDVVVLRYGSDEALATIAALGAEVAAVLVEPVQSRKPGLQPVAFLRQLRQLTSQHGALLLIDEIITGFRSGNGGVQRQFGIEADLVTYGKVIGGGMPVGVVAGKARYMDSIDGGRWQFGDDSLPAQKTTVFAGTFCKHPLTLAACKAVLQKLRAEGDQLTQQLTARTRAFVDAANAYFDSDNVPLQLSQFSSLFRFEPQGGMDFHLQPIQLNLFFVLLQAQGVYVWERRTCFLSLAHSDADVAQVLTALQRATATLRAGGFNFYRTAVQTPQSAAALH